MRFVEAIRFGCPDCSAPVAAIAAGMTAQGRIYLTGTCHNCRVEVVLDIEKVITALTEAHRAKAN